MRFVVNYTKLGAMGFVSHLDFQRLWQRMFTLAGIPVLKTQGYNPHPRLRFAVPLATGFQSTCELLEVMTAGVIEETQLVEALNTVAPLGLEVLAATHVPEEFPKITALVNALEYRVELPEGVGETNDIYSAPPVVVTRAGEVNISDYLLKADFGKTSKFLFKVDNQKTLRPDDLACHLYAGIDPGKLQVTRTGIFARRDEKISPVPAGLSILFD